jgi:two-component system, chemotaxis family, sensor kinase Cph1
MSNLIFHKKNDYNNIYKDPLEFIDTLDNSKHIVLYYENEDFGKKIQYRFIKNGLKKGENCIYIIHEDNDSLIKNEMCIHGIDADNYIERGLLKIFKMPDFMEHSNGIFKGAEEVFKRILSDLRPPFRLVGSVIYELITEEQIEANLALEHLWQSEFDKFDGMILCPYDVKKSPTGTQGKWVEIILENHHSVILVTDIPEEGISINVH